MKTVLVTGASGFIAKHIIRELLEEGYKVKGSVRSDKGQQQVEALFPDAGIEFVRLDLTSDEGWADAMNGVDVLVHTASPFPMDQPKDPQDLIRPAVDGTKRALSAAQQAGVNRVILTSSCAAIYKDPSKARDAQSTRENWTDPQHRDVVPYEASKTLAERAAWDFVEQHPEMELTVINPGGVFGPPMDNNYGTSLDIMERMLSGADPALPNVDLPLVDVRDVARMHVRAIDNEATVGQRFPANAGALSMPEMAAALKAAHPDRKVPTRTIPNWVIRLGARFVPLMRTVSVNLGRNLDVKADDGPAVMGFEYIPSTDALLASASHVVGNGKNKA